MDATVAAKPKTKFPTIADVQARLGNVPDSRILSYPAPGTATIQDLLDGSITGERLYELVDGILVEKGIGYLWGCGLVSCSNPTLKKITSAKSPGAMGWFASSSISCACRTYRSYAGTVWTTRR